MAEIPGFVWAGIGIFIGIISLFLGFMKQVQSNAFFKIMFFVALGMVIFGFIKIRLRQKAVDKMIDEKRTLSMQRQDREVDIDIDDYRRNPQLRQQVLQGRDNNHSQAQYSYNGTPRTYPQQQREYPQGNYAPHPQSHHQAHPQQHHQATHTAHARFCTQCGSPLLKEHRFCPICGARV